MADTMDGTRKPASLGLLNALCLIGFGVLVGLAWSEWLPAGELATQAGLRAACERLEEDGVAF